MRRGILPFTGRISHLATCRAEPGCGDEHDLDELNFIEMLFWRLQYCILGLNPTDELRYELPQVVRLATCPRVIQMSEGRPDVLT
jgi:hypothetical protein